MNSVSFAALEMPNERLSKRSAVTLLKLQANEVEALAGSAASSSLIEGEKTVRSGQSSNASYVRVD